MVGLTDSYNTSDIFWGDSIGLKVLEYLLSRMGMILYLFVDIFQVQYGWKISSLWVYGLRVGSWCVMGQPHPVVVAVADAELKVLLLDSDLEEHLNCFIIRKLNWILLFYLIKCIIKIWGNWMFRKPLLGYLFSRILKWCKRNSKQHRS